MYEGAMNWVCFGFTRYFIRNILSLSMAPCSLRWSWFLAILLVKMCLETFLLLQEIDRKLFVIVENAQKDGFVSYKKGLYWYHQCSDVLIRCLKNRASPFGVVSRLFARLSFDVICNIFGTFICLYVLSHFPVSLIAWFASDSPR